MYLYFLIKILTMKKPYLFFALLISSATSVMAQPILNSTNYVYSIGDNQLYHVADTNSVLDPTVGSNVVFNYTGLRGYGMTQNQYIINPNTTTYSGDYPTADIADTSDALATNTRYAELIGTDSLINLGFVANVQGYGDIIARFNYNPEISMKFPFNYNDNYVDSFSGNFTILSQNTDGEGHTNVSADAWGQLQLPGGVTIDSVLRVRTVQHIETDTIQITFPPITINPLDIDGEIVNYYKPSLSKFPLLSYVTGVIKQGSTILDSNKTFISQYALPGVGIEQLENNLIDLNLYPNPAKENVTLTLSLKDNANIRVDLMNQLGQYVKTSYNGFQPQGNNQINLNVENIPSGIYFVNIYIDGVAVAKKLIIQ